mgnify:CR=1 FL=1
MNEWMRQRRAHVRHESLRLARQIEELAAQRVGHNALDAARAGNVTRWQALQDLADELYVAADNLRYSVPRTLLASERAVNYAESAVYWNHVRGLVHRALNRTRKAVRAGFRFDAVADLWSLESAAGDALALCNKNARVELYDGEE